MKIPLVEKPVAWIDLETTGLDPLTHEVIDVAIVFDFGSKHIKHEHLNLVMKDLEGDYLAWTTRCKPQRLELASPKALEVNGYAAHPELWDDAPTFEGVAPVIAALLKNTILGGYNVRFDASFLNEGLKRSGIDARIDYHCLDVVPLVYEHLLDCGLESLSLDAVCPFIGISNEGNHSALTDTLRARAVYKKLHQATFLDRAVWEAKNRR